MKRLLRSFPFYRQRELMQCGVSCLWMICRHYGITAGMERIEELCPPGKLGVSLNSIRIAAETLGLHAEAGRLEVDRLRDCPLPALLHWRQNHYVVLYGVTKDGRRYRIADPARGKYAVDRGELERDWCYDGRRGIAMLFQPEGAGVDVTGDKERDSVMEFFRAWGPALREYRPLWIQLLVGMLFGMLLDLALPFLLRDIVDVGIGRGSLGLIWLILIGETVIVCGKAAVGFIRRWITLHISLQFNLVMVSDFRIRRHCPIPARGHRAARRHVPLQLLRQGAGAGGREPAHPRRERDGDSGHFGKREDHADKAPVRLLHARRRRADGRREAVGRHVEAALAPPVRLRDAEGVIFGESLRRNIACGDGEPDEARVLAAAATASLGELVEHLPMGLDTRIGDDGHGLSQGQRQRVLIARAVYRDPSYIFLDEATNSLDTNTEAEITERLDRFYAGRTVIISAHRLSTVTRADNIVVLDKGRIVESGTHRELLARKGHYHRLVKNQLELGE